MGVPLRKFSRPATHLRRLFSVERGEFRVWGVPFPAGGCAPRLELMWARNLLRGCDPPYGLSEQSTSRMRPTLQQRNSPFPNLPRPKRYLLADGPLGGIGRIADDAAVERVAFDGLATGFANQVIDSFDREELGRCRSGVVINQFVSNGAVEIVGSV